MTTYNKLKIAILTIIASQNIYALNVDPAVIQSSAGELLYAELNFRQSDINTPIEVSLAKAEDLMSIGATHQPPGHLNFFTRRNANGTGVITITSSRPITDAELNIIVKIKEGSTTRLQQIKKPLARNSAPTQNKTTTKENALTPIVIVNEKDIALNLPTSSAYTAPAVTRLMVNLEPSKNISPQIQKTISATPLPPTPTPIVLQSAAPTTNAQQAPKETHTEQTIEKVTPKKPVTAQTNAVKKVPDQTIQIAPPIPQSNISADPLVNKYASGEIEKKSAKPAVKSVEPQKAETKKTELQKTDAKKTDALKTQEQKVESKKTENNISTSHVEKHVVRTNESLWAIAAKIADQQNRSVNSVMQQIKTNNEHAFIKGDVNRLKRGATLNLKEATAEEKAKKVAENKIDHNQTKQSGTAKYKLNQAEMSLVAQSEQNSAHGSASKSTKSNITSDDLSSKVMTSREKTVKLQRNVTQLEMALNQKDHRIQLLNARLAQLQQQLKKQQAAKKSHN
ncbi:FimV/HubP-related protein [Acinetobacter portensis]|uniref:FimV/HubP-related protein n=1 Tax=Acinetobacter portensis TaxID=1839785 RepID=UPI0013D18D87|nr:hypothetical protein [Acinetobacter portensis]